MSKALPQGGTVIDCSRDSCRPFLEFPSFFPGLEPEYAILLLAFTVYETAGRHYVHAVVLLGQLRPPGTICHDAQDRSGLR